MDVLNGEAVIGSGGIAVIEKERLALKQGSREAQACGAAGKGEGGESGARPVHRE